MQQSTSAHQKLNFSSFKTSFTSNLVGLKRRFSSGDLDNDDAQAYEEQARETIKAKEQNPSAAPNMAATTSTSSKTISAPTSPSKSTSSTNLFAKLQSSVSGVASNLSQQLSSAGGVLYAYGSAPQISPKIPYKDPNQLILLVIDDHNTDWSKYFKNRPRLVSQYEVVVEQCEFSELSVASYEGLTVCSYVQYQPGGNAGRQLRQFIPDFLLIRQNLRDAGRDYKPTLLAFMYGGLGSVNSLSAIYNFQDKPWVFAHMLAIQRRLGKEAFPLIDQNFYPDFQNMSGLVPRLPAVLKIGHAHGGLGKIRVPTNNDYQDASSVVAVTGTYCTSETYVDARCDMHIQKIGNQYKAFVRKGIVGHWKSGSGSAMLEQIPVTERYRSWVDNVATMFGGLDICALEVLVAKDGKEVIIEVNDSALSLMGESQEEDRRHIADLVFSRLQIVAEKKQQQPQQVGQTPSRRLSQTNEPGASVPTGGAASGVATGSISSSRRESQGSLASASTTATSAAASAASTVSAAAQQVSNKLFSRQNSTSATTATEAAPPTGDAAEDTMKNLRKTFAGIFGDM